MTTASPQLSRGILASIGSSVAFAGVYVVSPLLAPAPAEAIWGIRNLATLPVIFLALLAVRQQHSITAIALRVRRTPLLLLGIFTCGLLIAAQLWVFAWAPMHGRGLQVALGYFLLPLVLVVLGKVLYGERLAWWQWLAAGIAGLGVIAELIRVGGISWETLLVAIGYPCYFVLRRAMGTNQLGGMFWEFMVLAPAALAITIGEVVRGASLAANPALWWAAPLFAVWTAFALILYIMASRLLTLSIFGLLSYLEPALLVGVSILIGERISGGEWTIYVLIWIAVGVLLAGGVATILRSRRPPRS